MKFKTPELAEQFARVHPLTHEAVTKLDEWSKGRHFPEVTVTHVYRTPQVQEGIYWKGIFAAGGLTEEAAKAKARSKFSWHLVGCGCDLRNIEYSADQLVAVVNFLREGRDDSAWEILSHDVGRGSHLHVGFKDTAWRVAGGNPNKVA
jgi:hypothetical protein